MEDNPGPMIEHPLAHKKMIVCATKIDSANPEKLKKLTPTSSARSSSSTPFRR